MKSLEANKTIVKYVIFTFFLCLLFLIVYCFPIVGDDWYWTDGSRKIISVSSLFKWTTYYWENLNGRVLGNVIGLWVKQSRVCRAFVRAVIIWGIMILMYKNCGLQSRIGYGIAFIYAFAVPVEMFSQAYAWSCGFFNYVPPVFLILLYFYILQLEVRNDQKWRGGGVPLV